MKTTLRSISALFFLASSAVATDWDSAFPKKETVAKCDWSKAFPTYDRCDCARGGYCICGPGQCHCVNCPYKDAEWRPVQGTTNQVALHAADGSQLGNWRYSDQTWHWKRGPGQWDRGDRPPLTPPVQAPAPVISYEPTYQPTFTPTFSFGGGRSGGGC